MRVNETAGVCGVKSVCDLTEQAKRRAGVGPPLCEQLRKGRRIHEPAHDVETGGPGHFDIDELAPIEKRQQVRMLMAERLARSGSNRSRKRRFWPRPRLISLTAARSPAGSLAS